MNMKQVNNESAYEDVLGLIKEAFDEKPGPVRSFYRENFSIDNTDWEWVATFHMVEPLPPVRSGRERR